ncbi:PTS sugar transporter subunit IIA [Xylocopilactobacillus apis]|uniref:PTS EIIA type-4 domain-containing protein n=1 Tax=Xylocopilactobacillus apis TaxID=2932183 RepID=A0AAU9DFC3_9LACO|nr:PTS sugar transporter subunit IIA [Xylocopilactobacillus apis]BDR56941.1 hypothetical protein KIMC2_15030 [Xylocopilactobacillus apis]
MISLILVSHGDLAAGVKNAADIIFGKEKDVVTISYTPEIGPSDLKEKLEHELKNLINSNGFLFMADIFGGAPYNVAAEIVIEDPKNRSLLSGLNLSMLLEAYSARLSYRDPNKLADYLIDISKMDIKKFDPSIRARI